MFNKDDTTNLLNGIGGAKDDPFVQLAGFPSADSYPPRYLSAAAFGGQIDGGAYRSMIVAAVRSPSSAALRMPPA